MMDDRDTHKFIAAASDPKDLRSRVWRVAEHLQICIVTAEGYDSQARHCRARNMIEMACYLETAWRCLQRMPAA